MTTTRHTMRLVVAPGPPPCYHYQCTQCDVYTSKYWSPDDLGPPYHCEPSYDDVPDMDREEGDYEP